MAPNEIKKKKVLAWFFYTQMKEKRKRKRNAAIPNYNRKHECVPWLRCIKRKKMEILHAILAKSYCKLVWFPSKFCSSTKNRCIVSSDHKFIRVRVASSGHNFPRLVPSLPAILFFFETSATNGSRTSF